MRPCRALSRAGASPALRRGARPVLGAPIPRVSPGRPSPCRASGGDFAQPSPLSSQDEGPSSSSLDDGRPLFTLDRGSATHLTFEDIRDAYEMCSTIPDARERGQCYSVFNIDGERMASYYAPVSRLEDALLGGAAAGPRRALAEKAAAAAEAERQHQHQQQRQRQQPSGGAAADDHNNPLAFLARFFFPPSQ